MNDKKKKKENKNPSGIGSDNSDGGKCHERQRDGKL
jgi:hypothetical protein